jgi:ribosomal protein L14E/L6E/L27E
MVHGVFATMIKKVVDEKRGRSVNGFLGRWKKQGKRRQWRYNNKVFFNHLVGLVFFLHNNHQKVATITKLKISTIQLKYY